MPIVQVIINENGEVRSNLHFGNLSQEEADDLARVINTKLALYQSRSHT